MKRHPEAANPAEMPIRALDAAIRACCDSVHPSDRDFAYECELELRRRQRAMAQSPAHEQHQVALRRAA